MLSFMLNLQGYSLHLCMAYSAYHKVKFHGLFLLSIYQECSFSNFVVLCQAVVFVLCAVTCLDTTGHGAGGEG